jgi:hypothetical protein
MREAGRPRDWFVAGIVAEKGAAERCAVQFCRKSSDKQTMYLRDPRVKEQRVGPYTVVVRAPTPPDAGKWRDPDGLQSLAALAERLDFRPEIQIRAARIAAYPAGRNVSIDQIVMLENLFEFTRRSAAVKESSARADRDTAHKGEALFHNPPTGMPERHTHHPYIRTTALDSSRWKLAASASLSGHLAFLSPRLMVMK